MFDGCFYAAGSSNAFSTVSAYENLVAELVEVRFAALHDEPSIIE